jgi:hypothetical protein
MHDSDHMARAEALASLDHPNIGHIHGIVDSADSHTLVLALIEGPTLADRIEAGPIRLDEIMSIRNLAVKSSLGNGAYLRLFDLARRPYCRFGKLCFQVDRVGLSQAQTCRRAKFHRASIDHLHVALDGAYCAAFCLSAPTREMSV